MLKDAGFVDVIAQDKTDQVLTSTYIHAVFDCETQY